MSHVPTPDVRRPFHVLQREKTNKNPSTSCSDNPSLLKLIEPHISSFNAITDYALVDNALKNIEMRVIFDIPKENFLKIWIEDIQIGKPMLPMKEAFSKERCIYPSECRQRGITYEGAMMGKIAFQLNDSGPVYSFSRSFGDFPIMVRSNLCHLEDLSPAELIARNEEAEELGGYFIVNGIERLVRLLVVNRRNYPMAIIRSSFTKKGPGYTHFGVMLRSVRDDCSSQTITLHYLSEIGITVRFSYLKQEYLVPVLLIIRALIQISDKEIFEGVIQGDFTDTILVGQMESLLRAHRHTELYSQDACLQYIGSRFQAVFRYDDRMSEREIGQLVLRSVLLVHLEDPKEKVQLLLVMIRKLLALISDRIAPDNPDSTMNHEILLPGFLIAAYLKEKLDEMLRSIKITLLTEQQRGSDWISTAFLPKFSHAQTEKYCRSILAKINIDIGRKIRYFLGTGNMPSFSGMDLQQTTGYTVVAERLNHLRFLSHFRSVHRGAFFATLKTTNVRKLLPESWGFFCPVHTPDGAPCGLLNHLTHTCTIVIQGDSDRFDQFKAIAALLVGMGLLQRSTMPGFKLVMLDGNVIGYAPLEQLFGIVSALRNLKGKGIVPESTELVLIPDQAGKGLFPGLFIFTTSCRMVRPVFRINILDRPKYLPELIGTMEQVFLNIALPGEESGGVDPSTGLSATFPAGIKPTHIEKSLTDIFSVVANLTPFPDHNQSPRNMYQCQMAKQTMGTPCHTFPYRADSKLYRLQYGQSPIVRPEIFDQYQMDSHPNGTNALVAVISYTGYDMEDAMILNKSAFERGFGNGSIYKAEFIDLSTMKTSSARNPDSLFGCTSAELINNGILDSDGLPPVGRLLKPNDILYSTVTINDSTLSEDTVIRWKAAGLEEAYVDSVRLIGGSSGMEPARKALIWLRVPRPPIIGDKFSSRHGQKGVCSQKWPNIDMPFTENGLTPDIIINPHAFPSRMTIGMFIESMAGKTGALSGYAQDATPFRLTGAALQCFGEQLTKAGFSYYGSEPMYSGIFGNEMKADIFIGLVYYQRLRHMVSDKFQVRTTGPVHNLTRQPIKGRKRAGGIRFGEMERDSLLAHGVAFLLHDRLMNCSDYTQMHACRHCGDILSVLTPHRYNVLASRGKFAIKCLNCKAAGPSSIVVIALPFVYRYLVTELIAMNVRIRMEIK